MMMNRRQVIQSAIGVAAVASFPAISRAQAVFPAKPMKLINGFPPGGAVDTLSRLVAERMGSGLGQAVVIENKTGAAGAIAAEAIARSGTDGYTFGMLDVGALAVNPVLQKKISYDPAKDFVYLGLVARIPLLLVVNPSIPVSNIAQLTAHLKQSAGRASYASAGVGNALHLAMETYLQSTGASATHIPYRGAAPAVQDLLGGNVQMMFIDVNTSAQYIKTGKLKAIAIATPQRNVALPDVPTFIEANIPDVKATPWVGLVAPTGLAAPNVAKLSASLDEVTQSSEFQSKVTEMGFLVQRGSPSEFETLAKRELQNYSTLIKQRGIVLEG
jgi:tripartite-type tricarboxylate transporter receptor subunit TctC